jgi:hypothetical protein
MVAPDPLLEGAARCRIALDSPPPQFYNLVACVDRQPSLVVNPIIHDGSPSSMVLVSYVFDSDDIAAVGGFSLFAIDRHITSCLVRSRRPMVTV